MGCPIKFEFRINGEWFCSISLSHNVLNKNENFVQANIYMGHTYTAKLFVVFLKFKLNQTSRFLVAKFGNSIRNEWYEHLTSLTSSQGRSNQLDQYSLRTSEFFSVFLG